MLPSPSQLVLHLLSAAAPRPLPVSALVTAAGIFGHSGNLLRVTLTRLGARGMVQNVRRGAYALGPAALPVQAEVGAWRRDDGALTTRWDGKSWLAVMGVGASPPVVRVLGFRELAPGLAIRPANRRGGVAGLREKLEGAGVAAQVFVMSELDVALDARARSLWDTALLVAAHADLERRLEESMVRLASAARAAEPGDAALRETFVLGGAAIRALTLDPHLPEELCPGGARRSLRATMRRYDAMGLALWSARLEHPLESGAPALWSVGAGA